MKLLEWDKSLSVNVKEIDEQHKKLIDIINRLFEAMKNNHQNEILEKIIAELVEYADYHFSTEEKYFKKFNFAKAAEHIKEHDQFRADIKKFQNEFKIKKLSLPVSLLNYLHDWLLNHLEGTDRLYIECFNSNDLY